LRKPATAAVLRGLAAGAALSVAWDSAGAATRRTFSRRSVLCYYPHWQQRRSILRYLNCCRDKGDLRPAVVGSFMARVTYIDANGDRHEIELQPGETVMHGAVKNGLKGIIGECGGVLACGTCHVYVQQDWLARLPPAGSEETLMLEFATNVAPNSRLGCRLQASDALDGLVVTLPASQR
jgi:2Fe-2S ferredoxin